MCHGFHMMCPPFRSLLLVHSAFNYRLVTVDNIKDVVRVLIVTCDTLFVWLYAYNPEQRVICLIVTVMLAIN